MDGLLIAVVSEIAGVVLTPAWVVTEVKVVGFTEGTVATAGTVVTPAEGFVSDMVLI